MNFAAYQKSSTSHMNRAKYEIVLEKLMKPDKKAQNPEKRKILVSMVKLLFSDLDYMKLWESEKRTQTSELDLIYINTYTNNTTILNDFGRCIVVECKNWKEKVGAPHVRDLAMKLLKSKVTLGLLFTREGVTGKKNRDAKGEIRFLCDKFGIYIIDFGIDDLIKMREEGNQIFYDVIETKLLNLQFSV